MNIEISDGELCFILDCLKWNRYHYSQLPSSQCWKKEETLEQMGKVMKKLNEYHKAWLQSL